jgi:hypothetical protein
MILQAFESHSFSTEDIDRYSQPMDHPQSPRPMPKAVVQDREKKNDREEEEEEEEEEEDHFFQTKYLTNSRLFHLQLRDPVLRESMLTQVRQR